MRLVLVGIEQKHGAATHLYPLDMTLVPGAVTVLLGATQAGKTTLMRVMAGLDKPTRGHVMVDGRDVTGLPVRERNVAMVYQQFINYPSMTVAENIASPLKLRGLRKTTQTTTGTGAGTGSKPGLGTGTGTGAGTGTGTGTGAGTRPREGRLDKSAIEARVQELARKLHIEPFLNRLPAELSGGQQQRVALARALAKDAPLMLLDEPLVNLDYKLREELRDELSQLFAAGRSTVVYATTEPTEALLLGGHTAVMDAGELLQYGPTADVFRRPASVRVARAFSDPPMNLIAGSAVAGRLTLPGGTAFVIDGAVAIGDPAAVAGRTPETTPPRTSPAAAAIDGPVTLGVRAGALRVHGRHGDIALPGRVELAEISGSDTFVHADTPIGELVAQLTGVHQFELGAAVTLYLDPRQAYVFDAAGQLALAPADAASATPHTAADARHPAPQARAGNR